MDAPFLAGHATHPDWRMALSLAAAQIDAQLDARRGAQSQARVAGPLAPPTLGLVYASDHFGAQAQALGQALTQRWPGVRWAGCTAVGIAACGAEYFDEPALSLMLCALPEGSVDFFNGQRPLGQGHAHTALVHADPSSPDLTELLGELGDRVASGYLFGGVVSARQSPAQFADGVWHGGITGVSFSPQVPLISRVTQGCQPVGPERVVTAAEGPLVMELDGAPAMPRLLGDLQVDLSRPREAMPALRATLVGLSDADGALLGRGGQFGPQVRVRHLVGLDPGREAVAVAEHVEPGMRMAFCQRNTEAARRDLVRICSEIRDEVGSAGVSMRGAIYVSCNGRGGPHFGAPSAELKTVQHALGEVPLVGFFAAGEIARQHLYGYTGVLTVFTTSAP